jgi:hypothetical protein
MVFDRLSALWAEKVAEKLTFSHICPAKIQINPTCIVRRTIKQPLISELH